MQPIARRDLLKIGGAAGPGAAAGLVTCSSSGSSASILAIALIAFTGSQVLWRAERLVSHRAD
jgi:hypothetical protein